LMVEDPVSREGPKMASSSSRAAASKKIIRPWLAEPGGARDHDKEVYLADPWLQDPVHTRKMFTLAGFVATARVSAEEMRRQKEEIMANIRRLGGEIIETDEWDERVTHVVAHVDGKKESMSEKVMAGLAAGRWVLTRRYVDKCARRGAWLPSPALFITSEAVVRHRRVWHQHGAGAAVFSGMRAALLMSDPRKNAVYKRIVLAGGGTLVRCHSLHQLVTKPPRVGDVTHVFTDPWILHQMDPRHALFTKFKNYSDQQQLNIQFLYYKYLFMKIRQFPEPHHTDFSIFNPKIQEMGARDYELLVKQMPSLKRPQESNNMQQEENKKRRTEEAELVILEDSDEEETPETVPPQLKLASIAGLVIEKVVEDDTRNMMAGGEADGDQDTGYVSQSHSSKSVVGGELGETSIATDPSEGSTSEVVDVTEEDDVEIEPEVVTETPDVKVFPLARIDTNDDDISDDDDDDIMVLEQKLAASRKELGTDRHYLETDKATSKNKKNVVNSAKRAAVYIPSQRDEYLKQSVQNDNYADGSDYNVEMVTLDDSESDSEDRMTTVTSFMHLKGRISLGGHRVRDSELQHDGRSDDIVEVRAPAPDIVNIDSDDDEEELQSVSSTLDAEPDKHHSSPVLNKSNKVTQAVNQKPKYKTVERTSNLKVRSQKEEFLLAARAAGRSEEVRSQRQEFLLAVKGSKEQEQQEQEGQQEEVALKFLEEVETQLKLAEPQAETSPQLNNAESAESEKAVKTAPISVAINEFDYEDVFEEPTAFSSGEVVVKESESQKSSPNKISSPHVSPKNVSVKASNDAPVAAVSEEEDQDISLVDDESDFSLSEGEEEDSAPVDPVISSSTLLQLRRSRLQVDMPRLPASVFRRHHQLAQDYLARRLAAAAPEVEEQEASTRLVTATTPQKQSSSLLYRILATLARRFSLTQELLDLCPASSGPATEYDRHGEKSSKRSRTVKTVAQNIEVDLVHLIRKSEDTESDDDMASTDSSDEGDGDDFNVAEAELRRGGGRFISDSITCVKRLKMETCSTVRPNSKILNVIFKNLLLEESNPHVLHTAVDYLNHFLFLHCNNSTDMVSWRPTILSALRNLKEEKLFKTFNLSNAQELVLCAEFWREIVDRVIHHSEISKCLHSGELQENDDITLSTGPFLLLQFLVKLLRKDFEIWWKKKYIDVSEKGRDLPLLFYLLGGSVRDLLKMIKATVLKLYKHFLRTEHRLAEARQLVSMCAVLISYLDFHEEFGALYWGDKRSLAMAVCDVLTEAQLPATQLYTELSLTTPAWFSVMLSHRLLARCSRQYEKVTDVSCLRSRFESLSQCNNITIILAMDNFAHKQIGFQHIHTVFRAYWHFFKNPHTEFRVYKHLAKLEDSGSRDKVLRHDDILFHLPSLTETVALLTDFANGRLSFYDDNCQGNFDEIGALRALMFPMSGCDTF